MPFVAAPNCVSLALRMLLDSEPVENTFHYRLPAPATADNLAAIIAGAFTYYGAHRGNFNQVWFLTNAYARALDTAASPSVELNPAAVIQGSDVSELQPNNVSFALTRFTGLAGRANRGRVYHPGISRDLMAHNNFIDAAQAIQLVAFYDGFLTAELATTAAAQEVILHKATGTHTDVLGYRYADLALDSQRRRLPGHNIHH